MAPVVELGIHPVDLAAYLPSDQAHHDLLAGSLVIVHPKLCRPGPHYALDLCKAAAEGLVQEVDGHSIAAAGLEALQQLCCNVIIRN